MRAAVAERQDFAGRGTNIHIMVMENFLAARK
jgi:hypothetical protein